MQGSAEQKAPAALNLRFTTLYTFPPLYTQKPAARRVFVFVGDFLFVRDDRTAGSFPKQVSGGWDPTAVRQLGGGWNAPYHLRWKAPQRPIPFIRPRILQNSAGPRF